MSAAMPADVLVLTPADYQIMPWRNGRGTTVEVLREDDPAGGLLWRVSMADVIEAGDFSKFPGVDRILMLVEGAGFDLDFGGQGGPVAAEPLMPLRFSGDWDTRAENVRGPSRDLNVMVARGQATADVSVRAGSFDASLAGRNLFVALSGDWTLRTGGETYTLAAEHARAIRGGAGQMLHGQGAGTLVQVDVGIIDG